MFIGIDLGTTACKVARFDESGRIVAQFHKEYGLITRDGFVEQDAGLWWQLVLEGLRAVGAPTVRGISISTQGVALVPVDAAGEPLSSFFDALYLSYLMHCRKPEPEIFLSLLAKEGVAAGEALFFDDSAENCEAARALGLDAVLLERNAPWSGSLMNF